MNASLIEKFDNSRYSLVKWLTIGWGTWFGTYIIKDWISHWLIIGILILTGLIGWVLFAVNLYHFIRLGKQINADGGLKEALNNEMHELYKYKSFFFGFQITLLSLGILMGLSAFMTIPGLFVCQITIFLAVLSSLTAWLIYNKG